MLSSVRGDDKKEPAQTTELGGWAPPQEESRRTSQSED